MAKVAQAGKRPSAGVIQNHEDRITAIEHMQIYPDGSGQLQVTKENVTLTIGNGGDGNLSVWLVTGGVLQQAKLQGSIS